MSKFLRNIYRFAPMLASDFISLEVPILKITDTCEQVLRWMDEYRVLHMPVFDGADYIGLISEADLLGAEDEQSELRALSSKCSK